MCACVQSYTARHTGMITDCQGGKIPVEVGYPVVKACQSCSKRAMHLDGACDACRPISSGLCLVNPRRAHNLGVCCWLIEGCYLLLECAYLESTCIIWEWNLLRFPNGNVSDRVARLGRNLSCLGPCRQATLCLQTRFCRAAVSAGTATCMVSN